VIESADQLVEPEQLIELIGVGTSDPAAGSEKIAHDQREHREDEKAVEREREGPPHHIGSLS
jgi:hypothetical protein